MPPSPSCSELPSFCCRVLSGKVAFGAWELAKIGAVGGREGSAANEGDFFFLLFSGCDPENSRGMRVTKRAGIWYLGVEPFASTGNKKIIRARPKGGTLQYSPNTHTRIFAVKFNHYNVIIITTVGCAVNDGCRVKWCRMGIHSVNPSALLSSVPYGYQDQSKD